MNNQKILYLYTGDHPIHRKFAISVGAEVMKMSWKIPGGYDIYFSEGEFFKLIILRFLGKISKRSKIVNLFSDPRLFYLDRKIKFNPKGKDKKIERASRVKQFIFKKLMNELDGVICVGNFEKSLLEKYYFGPFRKVDIFVDKDLQSKLFGLEPNLENKAIIFLGNGADTYYKGTDLLLQVAKENPEIAFTIGGGEFERFLQENTIPSNMKFIGKYKMNSQEFLDLLQDQPLYLHLGRGEAFGITIIEATSVGIPAIVSELTGAKEAIEKVDEQFVTRLKIDEINKKIQNYFNLSLQERNILSKKFREMSKFYNEEDQIKNFKHQFEDLVTEIYGKK